MAKKSKKADKAPATAKAIEPKHEVYCPKCEGMVNGNGCAEAGCPVKAR